MERNELPQACRVMDGVLDTDCRLFVSAMVRLGSLFSLVLSLGCSNSSQVNIQQAQRTAKDPAVMNELKLQKDTVSAPTMLFSELNLQEKLGIPIDFYLSRPSTMGKTAISLVSKSCTCVSVAFNDQPISIGDENSIGDWDGELKVTIAHTPNSAGTHQSQVVVAMRDTNTGIVSRSLLTAKVEVLSDIEMTPKMLVFDNPGQGEVASQEVVISYRQQKASEDKSTIDVELFRNCIFVPPPIQIEKLQHLDTRAISDGIIESSFRVQLRPRLGEKGERLEAGKRHITVSRYPDHKATYASFPIYIRDMSGLDFPREVQIGNTRKGISKSKTFRLRSMDNTEFRIIRLDISEEEDCFTVESRDSNLRSTEHWLKVTGVSSTIGTKETNLQIGTDYPHKSLASLRLKLVVTE